MRIATILVAAILCISCAQTPPPQTASVTTPQTKVVVVEKPVIVEKQVVVEKPIIVEKKVVVTKPVIVEKPVIVTKKVTKASGSRCHWVNSYKRKNGTRVRGHMRCRK